MPLNKQTKQNCKEPSHLENNAKNKYDAIYQPLRSGRIWHKVNF